MCAQVHGCQLQCTESSSILTAGQLCPDFIPQISNASENQRSATLWGKCNEAKQNSYGRGSSRKSYLPLHAMPLRLVMYNRSQSMCPLLQELEVEATCFICQKGDSSMAAFLNALPRLESVRLRSDVRAVEYHSALTHLSGLKRKQWEVL